jgi:hypothetical protein
MGNQALEPAAADRLRPPGPNSHGQHIVADAQGRWRDPIRTAEFNLAWLFELSDRPTVVQADAQNVVGDVRAVIAGEQADAATGDRRDEGARDVAEIDIEVFELGGSVAADNALDTGADGPPDTRCGAACRSR